MGCQIIVETRHLYQTINVSVEEPLDAIPSAICIEDDPIDLFTILDDSIPYN